MKKIKKRSNWNRRIKWLIPVCLILVFASIAGANYAVECTTDNYVFQNPILLPQNKAGLLLGTSKTLRSGMPNQYFENRIQAATQLYKAGKIEIIVISGDNSREGYNEPEDMKQELMKQGIPENKIYQDYAGFRTLDSVIRMKEIFGQSSFTIVSQEFHNRRAVYLARAKGLQAIGFNARDVDAYNGFKTQFREKFARVKLLLDLCTNKSPKFLGDPVNIE